MSHSFRQPVGAQPTIPVAQSPLPTRIVAPICTTGSPAVYPVIQNAYGILTQQSQPYIAQPVIYPQPLMNVPNRTPFISAVPSNVPRVFVPVTALPTGMSPTASDPAKLLEEQKRLERERYFQLQQDRLKQFTVGGKKSNINADNLINSMFGNLPSKKNSGAATPVHSHKVDEIIESENKIKKFSFEEEKVKEPPLLKSDFPSTFTSMTGTTPAIVKKDAKEIESMMFECSNLNAPSKALKFHKPSIKEIVASSTHKTVFTASEKARDWRNIKGLDEAFTVPKPRFPAWCEKGKVPELYKTIQAIVTNNDSCAPDTNLLFPILVSSGLSCDLLGQIWELVNESASGQLNTEELFAVLALIAVVQAGHPVKNIDILHKIPSCPIPQLSFFANTTASLDQSNTSPSSANKGKSIPETNTALLSKQSTHQIVKPTAISVSSPSQPSTDQREVVNITENVTTWTPFASSQSVDDDEFDDFKSATPTAVNVSVNLAQTHVSLVADDDFDDFKQAPCVKELEANVSTSAKYFGALQATKKQKEVSTEDLMSPDEDKYNVFRCLQQTEDTTQWGDFTFSSVPNEASITVNNEQESAHKENCAQSNNPSVLITKSAENTDLLKTNTLGVEKNIQEDDEFGDFIHANVPPSLPSTTVIDFADFSNFKQADSEQVPVSQLDDEFGEFTSCVPISLKPEFGHEFLFHQLKDNISLAESQSVSSLELGTFDGGGGHSGESKSSLSRQGSIPSLDLKSAGLDGTDSEDCLGEIQLSPFVFRNSNSPSPVNNIKGSDENETPTTPVGRFFQTSTLPFTDKYSVIRQEKVKEEDQHISCWICCLQSAINILQNTKKIFNQMSCSSVCNEVLISEEGRNYVKNVIEVYKVICRIGLSSKTLGKQTEAINDSLSEADQAWSTICGFFAGSTLMPEESSLDFSSCVLRPESENNTKACGLCLLNIELRSKAFRQEEYPTLSYGGKNYHSTCANFWVNCVDPLLPALALPQLL